MHAEAAFEWLFIVDLVSKPAIKLKVRGEQLVGIEPDFAQPYVDRGLLGMGHKLSPVSTPLEFRRNGYVLDEEMVGLRQHLN